MKKLVIPQQDAIPYLKTLLFIASADETLTDEELEFFSSEGNNAGLSNEEVETAVNWIKVKKESLESVVKGIKNEETKNILITRLLELCYSDGDYSLPEKNGMADLCILLDFDFKKLKKLESNAEFNHKMKAAGNSVTAKLSKAFDASKKGTEQLGKKIAESSSDIAHSVASGLGAVGSKIAFSLENAKKSKEENKELREKLKKNSVTEAVKQKVILQLHSKILALGNQLKEEKKRNEQNEEMIRLLQEVSVEEMVDAYTAFPNKGIRIEPHYVTRIEDSNGNVLATFTPKTHEIISESTSYKMITMLRNVIDGGTGARVRFRYGLKMQMGGKTGTTQHNSDGWFMGFTPSLVNGCWVGGEDRAIHFDSMREGQGASMALPIWAIYMKKVLANPDLGYSADEVFDIPKNFNANAGCEPDSSVVE